MHFCGYSGQCTFVNTVVNELLFKQWPMHFCEYSDQCNFVITVVNALAWHNGQCTCTLCSMHLRITQWSKHLHGIQWLMHLLSLLCCHHQYPGTGSVMSALSSPVALAVYHTHTRPHTRTHTHTHTHTHTPTHTKRLRRKETHAFKEEASVSVRWIEMYE